MKRLTPVYVVSVLMLLWSLGGAQEEPGRVGNSNSETRQSSSVKDVDSYSPQVKAALIALFGLFLTTLFTTIMSVRQTRKEREKAKRVENTAKSIAEQMALRFIYRTHAIHIEAEIEDFESSATIRHKWDTITISRQGATVAYMPGHSISETPGCTVDQYPVLKNYIFDRAVDLNVYERLGNGYRYYVQIMGSLHEGQSLSYEIEARLLKAYLMTEEDVVRHAPAAFRREYHMFTIVSLVDELVLFVRFPAGFQTKFFFGVIMGDVLTESLMDAGELNRIEINKGFQKDLNWARLKVPEPLIGFTYLIYWTPPPRKVVDALKGTTVK